MNWKQNDWTYLLLIVNFIYNNLKNAIIGHIPFKFNFGYHLWVFFEKKCNIYSKYSSANRLDMKLKNLINISYQNFLHAQNIEK